MRVRVVISMTVTDGRDDGMDEQQVVDMLTDAYKDHRLGKFPIAAHEDGREIYICMDEPIIVEGAE